MKFMHLSKREKHILALTIVIISSILLYNFIFEPALKKWQAVNMDIAMKKAKFYKGLRLLEKRNAIISEYNQYAASSKNISQILNYIENLADKSEVRTSNIKPSPARQDELYKEYTIEVQVEGQFPDIIRFLSELIKQPTFVTVRKIDFRTLQENPNLFKSRVILSKITID